MSKKNRKDRILLSLLTISLLLSSCFASSAQAKSILEVAPENPLMCVRLNNLDSTLSTLDQFLMGVSPMPMSTAMLAKMQLGAILGNPALTGLDATGEFAFVALTTDNEEPDLENGENILLAIYVPTPSYETLLASCSAVVEANVNGVSKLKPVMGNAQDEALSMIQIDNYAVIAVNGSAEDLLKLKSLKSKVLASKLNPQEKKIAANNALFVIANVKQAYPVIEKAEKEMLAEIENAASTTPELASSMGIFKIYASLIKTFLAQSDKTVLAIDFEPEMCRLTSNVSSIKGSNLNKALSPKQTKNVVNPLLGYLESGQAITCAATMQKQMYHALAYDVINSIKETNPSFNADFAETMLAIVDSMGDHYVLNMGANATGTAPFTISSVYGMDNPVAYEKLMKEYANATNEMLNELMGGTGIKYNFEVGEKDKNNITSARMKIIANDPNSPEGQMIQTMYSDAFEYRWAQSGKLMAMTMGGDVDKSIRSLVAKTRTKSIKKTPLELSKAFEMIPNIESTDFYGTYNYINLMRSNAGIYDYDDATTNANAIARLPKIILVRHFQCSKKY